MSSLISSLSTNSQWEYAIGQIGCNTSTGFSKDFIKAYGRAYWRKNYNGTYDIHLTIYNTESISNPTHDIECYVWSLDVLKKWLGVSNISWDVRQTRAWVTAASTSDNLLYAMNIAYNGLSGLLCEAAVSYNSFLLNRQFTESSFGGWGLTSSLYVAGFGYCIDIYGATAS